MTRVSYPGLSGHPLRRNPMMVAPQGLPSASAIVKFDPAWKALALRGDPLSASDIEDIDPPVVIRAHHRETISPYGTHKILCTLGSRNSILYPALDDDDVGAPLGQHPADRGGDPTSLSGRLELGHRLMPRREPRRED